MKKKIIIGFSLLVVLAAAFFGWQLAGPATAFSNEKYFLYIRTGMSYEEVLQVIEKDTVVKSSSMFNWLAHRMSYPTNVKAGKYEIKKGANLINILRMLHNGRQIPVNLVITKLRTKEDLASMIGKRFECDSAAFMHFLLNNDTLKEYKVDSNTVMSIIFPNTYTYFWNTTPSRIFKKLFATYKEFWTPERIELAKQHDLNPTTAYILASIVEEETNMKGDKPKVASVYINRLETGMKLAADPTVKYALRNFELKRIYDKYLLVESPYNTYKYAGLPPGPICTPSEETLEAVLNSPKTNYLYFVAKPDFSGYSNFAETYPQHLQFAKAYQKALDEEMRIGRALKDSAK
ncbi:MAG: endolytic transglycosylase MltG [Bacteroidetes bacterium]|nr:endolytic transglycosylase MltG [Bacteroidota bacterium]